MKVSNVICLSTLLLMAIFIGTPFATAQDTGDEMIEQGYGQGYTKKDAMRLGYVLPGDSRPVLDNLSDDELERVSESGDAWAQYYWAQRLLTQDRVEVARAVALDAAVIHGFSRLLTYVGSHYLNRLEMKNALVWYTVAGRMGDPRMAMFAEGVANTIDDEKITKPAIAQADKIFNQIRKRRLEEYGLDLQG